MMGETGRKKERAGFPLWIERTERIISFHSAEGFEKREFGSWTELFNYALALASAGYRVQ